MVQGRMSDPKAAEVLAFWRGAGPAAWFRADPVFDGEVRRRFEPLHLHAAARKLDDWAKTADGLVALLIVLDQFPRNMYRGTAHAYATDPLARMFARGAIERGLDQAVDADLRGFVYLPFEHSEHVEDQALACALFEQLGDPEMLKWALLHREIIARFGRFPHRNAALGRETTEKEARFLAEGGFAG